jgi:zeaxanthin glucosyltransferase
MTHFAIFCPGTVGHLNPMCVLGRELLRRGHRVTLFGLPDVQSKVAKSGLEFYEIGRVDFPLGAVEAITKQLGELSGLPGLKFSIQFFQKEAEMLFREAPAAIAQSGVEALIIDQVTAAAGTVADRLKLPFVTICNALLVHREPIVPPYFTHWQYQPVWWAKVRNQLGNTLLNYLTRSIWNQIVHQRQQWQLPPHRHRHDVYSQLAQICQLPKVFDFPRQQLPRCLHYVGPLQDPSGLEPIAFEELPFPFDQLLQKPLVYASLGTLQNKNWKIFRCIAESCLDLDVQLVISLGNPNQAVSEVCLPGSPIVVAYAPHQKLIERSSLVVTHAGLNTVIGTLSAGIPIVAIPITNEQPGIAARLARTGAGKVVPLAQLSIPNLKAALTEVLEQPVYRDHAAQMQVAIRASGGVQRAADIIEEAIGNSLSS